jgi:hypothetical protein
VVAVLLLLALLGQVFHYFRTDIALRMPATAAAYDLLGVAIPLPRNPALVSIETSDLQSDNARGLFVLQATLKNRAAHPQAWPALELSLTDTNDAVVARRVMYAAEYLPPGTTSDAFRPMPKFRSSCGSRPGTSALPVIAFTSSIPEPS